MRILIIEDEPRIRDFLTRAFRAEGFSATATADGNAGVRQAITGEHDLVVLDLLLPGLNGLEVMAEIRRHQPELPVLILSARADLATRLRGAFQEPVRQEPWNWNGEYSHGRNSSTGGLL